MKEHTLSVERDFTINNYHIALLVMLFYRMRWEQQKVGLTCVWKSCKKKLHLIGVLKNWVELSKRTIKSRNKAVKVNTINNFRKSFPQYFIKSQVVTYIEAHYTLNFLGEFPVTQKLFREKPVIFNIRDPVT